jgi:uncharacterized protein with PIN domain
MRNASMRRIGKASGWMAPAFAAERTLGRLGKWLRLLGFDTIIETEFPQGKGFEPGDDRILLTRTRRVMTVPAARAPVWIRANDPFEQLGEVLRAAALSRKDLRPFTRCLRCNEPIVPVSKAEVQRRVPDYVWQRYSDFKTCPRCGRVYWPGTHTTRSLERIKDYFG